MSPQNDLQMNACQRISRLHAASFHRGLRGGLLGPAAYSFHTLFRRIFQLGSPILLLLTLVSPGFLIADEVKTGLDVLVASDYSQLKGRHVGLITNHTGVNGQWESTIDLLFKAPGVKLVALFSPEHGVRGVEDGSVPSAVDQKTGVPIYSLYAEKQKRPTEEMLQGIDTLVFDIQDVGARFYTYITTLAYTMEAAAKHHIKYVVLDRPNPITGLHVEGPSLDAKLVSFVGYFEGLPIRHGMTVGELARMYNAEKKIGADLEVISMRGWRRREWFDETGLPWINPSPNMRNLNEATLYPAVAVLEGTNISVGRGTDTPFEVFGAPWVDGTRLSKGILAAHVAGLRIYPIRFVPQAKPFANELCGGVFLMVVDRDGFDASQAMVALVSALHRLYPDRFQIDKSLTLLGNEALLQQLKSGAAYKTLFQSMAADQARFLRTRSKYLLYK
jgi:uncharacterized protein YbbC (DUF1343 family)